MELETVLGSAMNGLKFTFSGRSFSLPDYEVSNSPCVIFDHIGRITIQKPVAFVVSRGKYNAQVAAVDILGSLDADPFLIRNPLIGEALEIWWRIASSHSDIFNDPFGSDFCFLQERVRSHLKSVGNIISRSRTPIPWNQRRQLIAKMVCELDVYPNYLRIAWERLSNKHLVATEDAAERIHRISKYLKSIPTTLADRETETTWNLDYGFVPTAPNPVTVIGFLKGPGRKYVLDDHTTCLGNRRPQWRVFKRAFIAWRLGISQSTLTLYLKTSVKDDDVEYGSRVATSSDLVTIVKNHLQSIAAPLKAFCGPFILPTPHTTSVSPLLKSLKRELAKKSR